MQTIEQIETWLESDNYSIPEKSLKEYIEAHLRIVKKNLDITKDEYQRKIFEGRLGALEDIQEKFIR